MSDESADGSDVEVGSPQQRARSRKRNLIAVGTSVGLLALALGCVLLLVTGFSRVGTSAATKPAKKKVVKVAKTTTTKPPPPPTTTSSSTTSSTTTSTTTSTSTTTTTFPAFAAVPPTAPPVTAPPATAPPPLPTATASASNQPKFCTVTVHLSNGAQQVFPLDAYVQNPGDLYAFTATLGNVSVDVRVTVVVQNNENACAATVSNVRR